MTIYAAGVGLPSAERRTAAERLVNALLFVTVLTSPLVFIEPSPYEAAFALLALAFFAARIPIDRLAGPPALLLVLWNVAGLAALLPVMHDQAAVTFTVTSLYLAVTAILFACLLADDPLHRAALLRGAYVAGAVFASIVGIAAYFHLLPNSEQFLLGSIRAKSTFKDPNVFGPFLILPLMFMLERMLRERFRVTQLAVTLLLLFALFVSFSRGAWAHFLVSAGVLVALMFLTSPNPRFRARVLALSLLAVVGLVLLLAAALSIDAISAAFQERASLLQSYDAGPEGRFGRQAEGLVALLEMPFGVGPLQFAKHFGHDPHNVYLNAFASYGWIGGFAYLSLVLATLHVGFRAALLRTPWQPYLLAGFAAFAGATFEGFVIDTDHWRHYYLLLGLIWGLSGAALRARRQTG